MSDPSVENAEFPIMVTLYRVAVTKKKILHRERPCECSNCKSIRKIDLTANDNLRSPVSLPPARTSITNRRRHRLKLRPHLCALKALIWPITAYKAPMERCYMPCGWRNSSSAMRVVHDRSRNRHSKNIPPDIHSRVRISICS